jgi:hypothetical protein
MKPAMLDMIETLLAQHVRREWVPPPDWDGKETPEAHMLRTGTAMFRMWVEPLAPPPEPHGPGGDQ